MATNNIGLTEENSNEICNRLNKLLANYSVFYMNVRGYHWNIQGTQFFTLHEKFEELYEDLYLKIDEIAERILTLGGVPLHSYTDLVSHSDIKEYKNVTTHKETVGQILEAFKAILVMQREILGFVGEIGDDGTDDMLAGYTNQQEKMVWMYSAFLNEKV